MSASSTRESYVFGALFSSDQCNAICHPRDGTRWMRVSNPRGIQTVPCSSIAGGSEEFLLCLCRVFKGLRLSLDGRAIELVCRYLSWCCRWYCVLIDRTQGMPMCFIGVIHRDNASPRRSPFSDNSFNGSCDALKVFVILQGLFLVNLESEILAGFWYRILVNQLVDNTCCLIYLVKRRTRC